MKFLLAYFPYAFLSRKSVKDNTVIWIIALLLFCSFYTNYSKTTQRNKQIAMGRKKFNMDPKKASLSKQTVDVYYAVRIKIDFFGKHVSLSHLIVVAHVNISQSKRLDERRLTGLLCFMCVFILGDPVSLGEWSPATHPWRYSPVPLQRGGSKQNSHWGLLRGTVRAAFIFDCPHGKVGFLVFLSRP